MNLKQKKTRLRQSGLSLLISTALLNSSESVRAITLNTLNSAVQDNNSSSTGGDEVMVGHDDSVNELFGKFSQIDHSSSQASNELGIDLLEQVLLENASSSTGGRPDKTLWWTTNSPPDMLEMQDPDFNPGVDEAASREHSFESVIEAAFILDT